jgi:hypothetical protein
MAKRKPRQELPKHHLSVSADGFYRGPVRKNLVLSLYDESTAEPLVEIEILVVGASCVGKKQTINSWVTSRASDNTEGT